MSSEDRIPSEDIEIPEQHATLLAHPGMARIGDFRRRRTPGFLQVCIESALPQVRAKLSFKGS
mgnify:CR=1 FL=1